MVALTRRGLVNAVVLADGGRMGADTFIAFFGLRCPVAHSEIDAVENNEDRRIVAARRARLQTYFGRLTDGEDYFLFIGTRLGVFGLENDEYNAFDMKWLQDVERETRAKLADAGLTGEPQLHLQFEAQY
jgi:hypothetical protein